MRLFCVVTPCLAAFAMSAAFGEAQTTAAKQRAQFRVSQELVQVPAIVSDRRGMPVTDLDVRDFEVREDGRQQEIAFFQRIALSVTDAADAPGPAAGDVASNDFPADSRAFLVLVDDVHIDVRQTPRLRRLLRQFIAGSVRRGDLVAMTSTSGQRGLGHDFTNDVERIVKLVDGISGAKPPGGVFLDAVHDARATADTLKHVADVLAAERRRRTAVVLLSQGVDYNIYNAMDPSANDVVRAFADAVAALNRANVTLYAVDPAGLTDGDDAALERPGAFAAQSEDTEASRTKKGLTSVTAPTPRERLGLARQSLSYLSEATGGFAAVDANDYRDAFDRIAGETSHYYLLGYYPSHPGGSNRYRRISVRVRRPGVRVVARQGYSRQSSIEDTSGSEIPAALPPGLASVLRAPLPKSDLALRVQAVPVARNRTGDHVQIIVEAAGEGLFVEGDRATQTIDLALITIDGQGRRANGRHAKIEFGSRADEVLRARSAGVRWLTAIDLAPGTHALRVAALTSAQKTGSVFLPVTVPHERRQVSLSPIVLTSRPAVLAISAGGPSLFPQLATPPTTARVFVVGDTIRGSVDLFESEHGHVPETVQLSLVSADGRPFVSRDQIVHIVRGEEGRRVAAFELDTTSIGAGRFVMSMTCPPGAGGGAVSTTLVQLVDR
jgi:VWFA-related protein